jgi:hypothetical protein
MKFRRVIGGVMFLTGIFGVFLCIIGLIGSRRSVDEIGRGLDRTFSTTIDSLQTTRSVFALGTDTVDQVSQAIGTLQSTATSVSKSISETRPFLGKVSEITTQDLPRSLDAVQEAVPAMANSAALIDDLLTTLSEFRYGRSVLGVTLVFDLGIDYAPPEPFDASVSRLGESLKDTPVQLRNLDVNFRLTDANLATISSDIAKIGDDVAIIGDSIAELNPLLNDYIQLIDGVIESLETSRERASDQLANAKLYVTLIVFWFGLIQIVPLYRGYEMADVEIALFWLRLKHRLSREEQTKDE